MVIFHGSKLTEAVIIGFSLFENLYHSWSIFLEMYFHGNIPYTVC